MTKRRNVEITNGHTPVLRPWSKLTNNQKHLEIVRFAYRSRGQALTLNLSPSFELYLASNLQPMRQVGKRMHAELRKLDLQRLPILMVLEATRAEKRLHLHGVFLANGVPLSAIQYAMRKAVGYISGRSGSRQFHSKFLFEPDGWSRYLEKSHRFTQMVVSLGDERSLWWVSHSMTQIVRDNYEAVRTGMIAAANSSLPPASTAS
jgi:hypothetical protein